MRHKPGWLRLIFAVYPAIFASRLTGCGKGKEFMHVLIGITVGNVATMNLIGGLIFTPV